MRDTENQQLRESDYKILNFFYKKTCWLSVLYHETKNPFETKICLKISVQLL